MNGLALNARATLLTVQAFLYYPIDLWAFIQSGGFRGR